jgi:hypothetical protein
MLPPSSGWRQRQHGPPKRWYPNCTSYIASNGRITVNDEMGKVWMETAVQWLGYALDDRGSVADRARNFFPTATRRAMGSTKLPNKWGTGGFYPGIKRSGREPDHSSPSGAEVNTWSYISIPPYVLMAWYLVKQRDNFTFIFQYRETIMACLKWYSGRYLGRFEETHNRPESEQTTFRPRFKPWTPRIKSRSANHYTTSHYSMKTWTTAAVLQSG